jgi:hypothetical protein
MWRTTDQMGYTDPKVGDSNPLDVHPDAMSLLTSAGPTLTIAHADSKRTIQVAKMGFSD